MIALLALVVTLHGVGGNLQVIHNTITERVQGACDSGEECGLTPLALPAKFRSPDFNCYGSMQPNPDLALDILRFYPSDSQDADVYAYNDGDSVIVSGTKVQITYTCEGVK